MNILNKIFGDPNEKIIKSLKPILEKVNSFEPEIKKLKEEDFKKISAQFKEDLKGLKDEDLEKKLNEILPKAFALVREASYRVLGQRHYDVQIIGGIILHRGQIAEMKTGEGKTLVATLPLYLNALAGKGAQLITVNDYLSRVGAGWMAPVYDYLGLSTGVIIHDQALVYDSGFKDESQFDERLSKFKQIERKEAYNCDIIYGTNNEFGFDYLRDNMAPSLEKKVQRDLHYVIVDEIDSILIDEARTPLIISAPVEEATDKYSKFAELVRRLKENEDYNVDEKMKAATLTDAGIAKMEKWLGVDNIYTSGGIREVHHIEQALKAYALFKKDKDYVVKDGEIIIVDEFTGRLMHGRRYSEGLHQAIEAKEGVQVQKESQTLATITFQNYFRMYKKLSGMTGTAVTEAEEFYKIYGLETVVIPTNKPNIRKDKNDLIYRTEEGKFKAVIEEVKKRNKTGQPILIGTISIEKNELLENMMLRQGLRPNVLNAKNHEKEARFIADAGKIGAITIATNMAGRGVDINLGGSEPSYAKAPEGRPSYAKAPEGRPLSAEDKEDKSLSAEDKEGRPLSAEDKENKSSDVESEEHKLWREEHEKVLKVGGLHVIGTERHESRRIDNQLRGRAGRQGDPGSSQFYVSMEDDLMRIFGGDRMKSIMTTLKVPEDMPIENKLISKSLESAQRKVEGNNFDMRKHLVEYDDVINKHRETIYKKRDEVLKLAASSDKDDREKLSKIMLDNLESEIEYVVSFHTSADSIKDWNLEEIYQTMTTIFAVSSDLRLDLDKMVKGNEKLDKVKARTKIIEYLSKMGNEKYLQMKKSAEELGITWSEIEKSVLIRSIDTLWVEHLEAMSSVRQGIGLRGYGQRDPLVEYKKEAYHLYNELIALIQKEAVYSIFKIGGLSGEPVKEFNSPGIADRATNFSAPAKTAETKESPFKKGDKKTIANFIAKPKLKDAEGKKIGRNDPCPCGSGKKYKKCCGR